MNTEYEIKLAPVLPHQAQAVFADAAVAPFLGPVNKIRMHSRYFDTPTMALGAGKYVLRMRRENEVHVCALKGPLADGARLELEAPADTLVAGIDALLQSPHLPPDARQALQSGSFEQIADITFIREAALWQREGLAFELAFDQGQCRRGARTGAIQELELELKSGDRAALRALADALCARHGLTPWGRGKLHQALALGEGDGGRAVSPFFVSNELLNYCVRMGWLTIEMDDQKRLHYRLGDDGAQELARRFGVDFGKPCAFAGEEE